MRSFLLAPLLLLSAGQALAQWTQYGASAEGTMFYMDFSSIRRNGNLRSVWTLQDYKVQGPGMQPGVRSATAIMQYDCSEQRSRPLSISLHSEQMAREDVL